MLVANKTIVLPTYAQIPVTLTSNEIEALVLRTYRLNATWTPHSQITPKNIISLHLPQSVNWLKLVNGRWLFVASSDRFVSKLSCWDLSMAKRDVTNPLAECYLPDIVNSGKAEVQDQGVVIALGVGSK